MIIERNLRPEDASSGLNIFMTWPSYGLRGWKSGEEMEDDFDGMYMMRRDRKLITSYMQTRLWGEMGHCIEGDTCRVPTFYVLPGQIGRWDKYITDRQAMELGMSIGMNSQRRPRKRYLHRWRGCVLAMDGRFL